MYVQYQNATKFRSLLTQLEAYLTIPINEYYENFFNIDTCDTQGLNNWGLILNQGRQILSYDYTQIFGFDTGVPADPLDTGYPQNFDHGNFFNGQTTTINLTDDQYRALLKLTYSSYTISCSVKACMDVVNNYIREQYPLNPERKCVIIEDNMSFIYSFNFGLQTWEVALFEVNQKLPRPAGIKYTIEWVV